MVNSRNAAAQQQQAGRQIVYANPAYGELAAQPAPRLPLAPRTMHRAHRALSDRAVHTHTHTHTHGLANQRGSQGRWRTASRWRQKPAAYPSHAHGVDTFILTATLVAALCTPCGPAGAGGCVSLFRTVRPAVPVGYPVQQNFRQQPIVVVRPQQGRRPQRGMAMRCEHAPVATPCIFATHCGLPHGYSPVLHAGAACRP